MSVALQFGYRNNFCFNIISAIVISVDEMNLRYGITFAFIARKIHVILLFYLGDD